MHRSSGFARLLFASAILFLSGNVVFAQRTSNVSSREDNSEFGPVMKAYLGYLRNEQDVVDDRISRREITPAYYRRNSNRIRALRQMAIRLASQTGNDYVPELEAVTFDEFGTIFEKPPKVASLRQNEILTNKFRFLGTVHSGEVFYLFARLDPYEQAALIQAQGGTSAPSTTTSEGNNAAAAKGQRVGQTRTRPRRTVPQ